MPHSFALYTSTINDSNNVWLQLFVFHAFLLFLSPDPSKPHQRQAHKEAESSIETNHPSIHPCIVSTRHIFPVCDNQQQANTRGKHKTAVDVIKHRTHGSDAFLPTHLYLPVLSKKVTSVWLAFVGKLLTTLSPYDTNHNNIVFLKQIPTTQCHAVINSCIYYAKPLHLAYTRRKNVCVCESEREKERDQTHTQGKPQAYQPPPTHPSRAPPPM